VNASSKNKESVKVFAARMGPRQVAKTEVNDRMTRMTSRFHKGQFYEITIRLQKHMIQEERQRHTRGSFGSSLGCGTRMMGTGPDVSHFSPADSEVAA
jgi:hypothetical protein